MVLTDMLFAYTLISTINLSASVKCFNCQVTAEILTIGYERVFTSPCSAFDGSAKYIIDCPYSTMCSRIITTMYLQKIYEKKIVILGCAQQKLLRHVLYEGKWKEEHSVQEIYSEDCKMMRDNNLFVGTKTYCYCRGDLCNSARNKSQFNFLLTFLVIISTFQVKIV